MEKDLAKKLLLLSIIARQNTGWVPTSHTIVGNIVDKFDKDMGLQLIDVKEHNEKMKTLNKNFLFRTSSGTLRKNGYVVEYKDQYSFFHKFKEAYAFLCNPVYSEHNLPGSEEGRMNS